MTPIAALVTAAAASVGLALAAAPTAGAATGQLPVGTSAGLSVQFGLPGDYAERQSQATGTAISGQFVRSEALDAASSCDTYLQVAQTPLADGERLVVGSTQVRLRGAASDDRQVQPGVLIEEVERKGRTVGRGGRWYQGAPTVGPSPFASPGALRGGATYKGSPIVDGVAVLPAARFGAGAKSVVLTVRASSAIRQPDGPPDTSPTPAQSAACAAKAGANVATTVRRAIRNARLRVG